MYHSVVILCLLLSVGNAERNLALGGGVNVFKFFGDLTITMRVDPRSDSDARWLFREPTPQIWKHGIKHKVLDKAGNFHGVFNVELCEGLPQLFQAYFRDLQIEGLSEPWKAFTSSWSPSTIKRKMGIPEEYQSEEFSYALIKVSHYVETAVLSRHVGVEDRVRQMASQVTPGDFKSVHSFLNTFGSHYISSYVVGDALFQVLVFNKGFIDFKVSQGPNHLLNDAFSLPSDAVFSGPIIPTSGAPAISKWARTAFSKQSPKPSLLNLRNSPHLLSEIRARLGPNALVKLKLKTLHDVFPRRDQKQWFSEVFDNHLGLYEMNA